MYLKTSDRRILFKVAPVVELLLRKGDPQGLRRLRFSFFLFTCQTAQRS
jgi:hypothetical protein